MKNKQGNYETYKKPNWWKRNTIEILIATGGLILIGLVFLAKVYRETDTLNIEGAAQLGDFVGGFIGTVFTLISILLLYSTLKEQRIASTIEKFETKYFELIKIHRENVNEMGLKDHSGKKIFVILVREFREILKISIKTGKDCNQILEPKDYFIISYHALFFGVGPNSSRMLKSSLSNYNKGFIEKFESTLNNKET